MQKKKILLIIGHPDSESYCHALAQAYKHGALNGRAEVREIKINELNFNPNLAYGYRKRTPWEPDLEEAWHSFQWADHLVWVFPVWWGAFPALMKGFIDRLFLPGFFFKRREDSLWSDPLFKGKSARIITTLDQPAWYYRWVYREPSQNALKKSILKYCGVHPVRSTLIGPILFSSESYRMHWLQRVERMGSEQR